MTSKVTYVELWVPRLNIYRKFEIRHAERILRMKNNGGWTLPENSNFKFDLSNGIGVKQDTQTNRRAEKKTNNPKGDLPSTKD